MNKKDIRVTYAVDHETVDAVEELAAEWGVSKSEAVRRAIRSARDNRNRTFARMTPHEVLDYLETNPLRTKEETDAWQKEAYKLRKSWSHER